MCTIHMFMAVVVSLHLGILPKIACGNYSKVSLVSLAKWQKMLDADQVSGVSSCKQMPRNQQQDVLVMCVHAVLGESP